MPTPEFTEQTEFTDAEKHALIDATMADLDRGWFADPEPAPTPPPASWVRTWWPFAVVLLVVMAASVLAFLVVTSFGAPNWFGYAAAVPTGLAVKIAGDRITATLTNRRESQP